MIIIKKGIILAFIGVRQRISHGGSSGRRRHGGEGDGAVVRQSSGCCLVILMMTVDVDVVHCLDETVVELHGEQ